MSCNCADCVATDHNSSYMSRIYDGKNYSNVLDRVVTALEELKAKHQVDTIAFSGTSGSAVSYTAGWATDLRLINVRRNDGNHHGLPVEGYKWAKRYVIVDDFVSTGATIVRIIREVKHYVPLARLAGIICWNASGFDNLPHQIANIACNNGIELSPNLACYSLREEIENR